MMVAMTDETLEEKLSRYTCVLDAQMVEIDKLRAEVQRLLDWIMGDAAPTPVCRPSITIPQRPKATGSRPRVLPSDSKSRSYRSPPMSADRIAERRGKSMNNGHDGGGSLWKRAPGHREVMPTTC